MNALLKPLVAMLMNPAVQKQIVTALPAPPMAGPATWTHLRIAVDRAIQTAGLPEEYREYARAYVSRWDDAALAHAVREVLSLTDTFRLALANDERPPLALVKDA